MNTRNSETNGKKSIDKVQIYSLLFFIICLLIGIFFPIFAVPLMICLLVFGLLGRRSARDSLTWNMSKSALASAIGLAVLIIVYLVFFRTAYVG
jgi:uncharacterized membrane protein YphA (DoxX/SURF4 family)